MHIHNNVEESPTEAFHIDDPVFGSIKKIIQHYIFISVSLASDTLLQSNKFVIIFKYILSLSLSNRMPQGT